MAMNAGLTGEEIAAAANDGLLKELIRSMF
jgi:hypothetical protein